MFKVALVLGTRPEIIKIEPVVKAFKLQPEVRVYLIYSGQHEDYYMFERFLDEFDMSGEEFIKAEPCGEYSSGSVRLSGLQRAINSIQPDIVLAVGDTYTVAYSALISHQARIPFGHIEAGLRSFDENMPEEGNRIIADHIAHICFCPTNISATNLSMEGINPNRIYVTGNTIVDCCLKYRREAVKSNITERLGLKNRSPLLLLTIHRVENTDNPERLGRIVDAVTKLRRYHIIFPIHPRTRDSLRRNGLEKSISEAPNVTITQPLGYTDFLKLIMASDLVMTDSGGVQEEAAVLGKRCLVLRESTERPETVTSGNCRVVGVGNIGGVFRRPVSNETWPIPKKYGGIIGDGRSGRRIVKITLKHLRRGFRVKQPSYIDGGYASYRLLKVRDYTRFKSLRMAGDISIIQVYGEDGEPSWPGYVKGLSRGMSLLLLGPPSQIKNLRL
ncbi:MAG: non-hydrolyzing UDP-N-acetylglucosamine 2-epimerase [Candidatus Bathyarchaeia archaeon]